VTDFCTWGRRKTSASNKEGRSISHQKKEEEEEEEEEAIILRVDAQKVQSSFGNEKCSMEPYSHGCDLKSSVSRKIGGINRDITNGV
jgi:hypothetical protein